MVDGSTQKKQFSSDQTLSSSRVARLLVGNCIVVARQRGDSWRCGAFAPNLNKIFTVDFAGGGWVVHYIAGV